ncbi:hypothetical protein GCM10007161_05340 [Ignatzschineria indica]|uniref:DUF2635 domain-containing protein n=1 Tax=Ignatzschineria indica TaxID=472583 RepID=A0A2U2AMS8_9GAMM|nr:DUF2635 domain-containing protein [Ignatzschineria indica]PWD84523.1 hypothetical protein DC082_03005 [Ignatzschineria indica]GGZ77125.1 hypothetical protein GCM10007161_05340 [Ignatzschineria indica]
MSKPLFVKASPGLKVPYENRANRYITDTAVEVPNTLYYRRRISDGDLIEVPEPKAVRKTTTKTEKGDQ